MRARQWRPGLDWREVLLGAGLWLLCLSGLTAAATTPVIPKAVPEVGHRYALVIGNAKYKNAPALANPVNDATDICAALKKLRFQTDCRTDLPTRRAMRDAVSDFTQKVKSDDVALFFFAGHGLEFEGENFLVPTDSEIRNKSYIEDETLRVSFVFDELRNASARLSIIILDACRNNPFSKVRAAAGTGLAIPTTMPAGSILIFPTSPGKVSHDGFGRNGLFTEHVLHYIQTPGISIEEMFKHVISGVRADSKKFGVEQIPWMNLSFTGEFCFVGCGTRVNTEEYLAVLQQKEQIEQSTKILQSELENRQSEISTFRTRMIGLEKMLDEQKSSALMSGEELARLNREKIELSAKTYQLQGQEEELRRVKGELNKLESRQAEFSRREQEMASAKERIAELERKIATQQDGKASASLPELDAIKREREELLNRNNELRRQQAESQDAKQELDKLRSQLVEFDRQRRELDQYKLQMARLEIESQQKDESVRLMRNELASRQTELQSFKERMALLQQQLEAQKGNAKFPQAELARLTGERDELERKAQQLTARERELKEAQEKLARLEALQAVNSRREQDIAAYSERISQLESQLAGSSSGNLNQVDMAALRRERDELKQRNQELQRQQPQTEHSRQELAELQLRLKEYDRQKSQLDSYKQQLAETEAKLKDAARSVVKGAAFVAPAM